MSDDPQRERRGIERESNDDPAHDGLAGADSPATDEKAWYTAPRRRVLQAVGGASAALALTGVASADDDEKEVETHDSGEDDAKDTDGDGDLEAPTPAEPEEDVGEEASVRFEDQVTDGSYVVAEDVVVPTAGFLSIHQLDDVVIDGEEFYYIDEENGAPQFAAQTIIGGSDFLEAGVYDRVPVDIYEDDRRLLVAETGQDRLEFPKPLLALMHIDGNDNEEFELFDNDDIVDAAYDFGETNLTPPFDRPSDIATLVPLEENAEEFDIFVERGEIELSDDEDD